MREFFSDGITWIHLTRTPLDEQEVWRLYKQLYNQLLGGKDEDNGDKDEHIMGGLWALVKDKRVSRLIIWNNTRGRDTPACEGH